jgi:hypothetical protein
MVQNLDTSPMLHLATITGILSHDIQPPGPPHKAQFNKANNIFIDKCQPEEISEQDFKLLQQGESI